MQAGQSGESRREWATAVLEALRSQNKLPGLGQNGQAEANGQQLGAAGSGAPRLPPRCLSSLDPRLCSAGGQ
jgi:hypothetical protein